jgi:hypothetical protein
MMCSRVGASAYEMLCSATWLAVRYSLDRTIPKSRRLYSIPAVYAAAEPACEEPDRLETVST